MSAPTGTRNAAKCDYQQVLGLMKEMGSPNGFNPMPPDQHKWQIAPGEDPLHRLWSWMCNHTIAWGHRSPFAVSKEGDELHLENIAADLGMDSANVYRYWREGLTKGLWRGGTRSEGTRRLYLSGKVIPEKGEETAKPKESTDNSEPRINNLPASVRKQIKDWATEEQNALADEIAREDELEKTTFATMQAATRSVFIQRKDNVYTRRGVKFNRQEHVKETETPEEATARRARIQPLLPGLETFVQTIAGAVQTSKPTSYNETNESVQPPSADPYLIEKSPPEGPEGPPSSSTLTPSSGPPVAHDLDGKKPVKEQYAPDRPDRAKAAVQTSAKPAQEPDPEEAMQLAKALKVDLDAAAQMIAGARGSDPKISLREIIALGYVKLYDWRHQIRDGKVSNVAGRLISAMPAAAIGGVRDRAKDRVRRDLERDIDYARLVIADQEASAEDQERERRRLEWLEAELGELGAKPKDRENAETAADLKDQLARVSKSKGMTS